MRESAGSALVVKVTTEVQPPFVADMRTAAQVAGLVKQLNDANAEKKSLATQVRVSLRTTRGKLNVPTAYVLEGKLSMATGYGGPLEARVTIGRNARDAGVASVITYPHPYPEWLQSSLIHVPSSPIRRRLPFARPDSDAPES